MNHIFTTSLFLHSLYFLGTHCTVPIRAVQWDCMYITQQLGFQQISLPWLSHLTVGVRHLLLFHFNYMVLTGLLQHAVVPEAFSRQTTLWPELSHRVKFGKWKNTEFLWKQHHTHSLLFAIMQRMFRTLADVHNLQEPINQAEKKWTLWDGLWIRTKCRQQQANDFHISMW